MNEKEKRDEVEQGLSAFLSVLNEYGLYADIRFSVTDVSSMDKLRVMYSADITFYEKRHVN